MLYKIVENDKTLTILLLEEAEELSGVIYSYGKVSFDEENLQLNYERDIVYVPDTLKGKINKDIEEKFTRLTSKILEDILGNENRI